MNPTPQLIRHSLLDAQVCVPSAWSDEQVIAFTEREAPCGTTHGWQIRKAGNELLAGAPERNACDTREGFVHITLDA